MSGGVGLLGRLNGGRLPVFKIQQTLGFRLLARPNMIRSELIFACGYLYGHVCCQSAGTLQSGVCRRWPYLPRIILLLPPSEL
jgi:hypothetical protein